MKLITQTIIRDEADRFLEEWLDMLKTIADKAVILDDASADGTPDIIERYAKCHKLDWTIIRKKESMFKQNELMIRTELWETVRKVAEPGDWILTIDSDEFDTGDLLANKQTIFNVPRPIMTMALKKIETWNENKEYRVDGLWSNYFTRLFRYEDVDFGYDPKIQGLHCPSIPKYAITSPFVLIPAIRIFHRGYETLEMRQHKYNFMKENANPDDKVNYNHVLSCIEPPELKKFNKDIEEPEINLAIMIRRKYDISQYLKKLKEQLYSLNKVNIMFVLYDCNYNVMESLENLEKENIFKSICISVMNLQGNDFHEKDDKAELQTFYKIPFLNFKRGQTFIVDIAHITKKDLLRHILLADKKFCYYGSNFETIYMEKIEDFNMMILDQYPSFKIGVFTEAAKSYGHIWNCTSIPWIYIPRR